MHIIRIGMLPNEQTWDTMRKILRSQICHGNKTVSSQLLWLQVWYLTKNTDIHGLQPDVSIVPHSLVPTILHEFLDSKGH